MNLAFLMIFLPCTLIALDLRRVWR